MVSTNTCDGSWLLTIYDVVTYYRAPTTQADPESDGPALPTSKDDEFRPFIRRPAHISYLAITPLDPDSPRAPSEPSIPPAPSSPSSIP